MSNISDPPVRSRRDSLSPRLSIAGFANTDIDYIKRKIKKLESSKNEDDIISMIPSDGTVVQIENILLNRKSTKIRKVYVLEGQYKVGWIADSDINSCMICGVDFWLGCRRHHCRACGSIVCSSCSPYRVKIPALNAEHSGSRACTECFGLRSNMTPIYIISGTPQVTPDIIPNNENSSGRRTSLRSRRILNFSPESDATLNLLGVFESQQLVQYKESYTIMRKILAPDIAKTSFQTIICDGVPEDLAERLWNLKALWLICMHPRDIGKVHIADLRGKYDFHNLDLIEMQAIWNNLPIWDDAIDAAKAEWREGFKTKMDWMAFRKAKGTLPPNLMRHPVYDGYENLSIYDPELPIDSRYERAASALKDSEDSPIRCRREDSHDDDPDHDEGPSLNHLRSMSEMLSTKTLAYAPRKLSPSEECDVSPMTEFYGVFDRPSATNLNLDMQEEMKTNDVVVTENETKDSRELSSDEDNKANSTPLTKTESVNITPLSEMLGSMRQLNRQDSILSTLSSQERRKTSSLLADFSPSTSPAPSPRQINGMREFKALIKVGQAAKARYLIKEGCDLPYENDATNLMFECLYNIENLAEPLGTFAVLVEVCEADVNAWDSFASNPLMILIRHNQQDLTTYFMSRGANVLQVNSRGECALSLAMSLGYDWVLTQFQVHQEDLVFSSSDRECVYQYISYLVMGGYGIKLATLIDEHDIEITPEEATRLYEKCRGRFDSMKNPVETFELLTDLGATME